MKQLKVQPLTRDAFAPFGEFYDMATPDGYALSGAIHKFYPDRLTTACEGRLAFSPLVVRKPANPVITQQEYHTTTEELILPLDDDMILHVAPASGGAVVTDYAKVFLHIAQNHAIFHRHKPSGQRICQLISNASFAPGVRKANLLQLGDRGHMGLVHRNIFDHFASYQLFPHLASA